MESYGRFGKQFEILLQRISSEFESRRGSTGLVQQEWPQDEGYVQHVSARSEFLHQVMKQV